ncbi:hypothetical protein GCM10008956_13500 [Deinococcus arenae]|uniref:Peptidase C39-like domain-containing protein n=1 Tax=Deinococcus arenae TaxID=1452751 RepID=A0A8H9GQS4_9DEIO|nr:hypothetical protein [Deinococcus arenae]AWT37737.1 hypothetical protein DM785_18805 [Deinococcus actinosclerus]GGM38369.1 hypothetical protein GCM10008956_13500 [Deinococcus arenae]
MTQSSPLTPASRLLHQLEDGAQRLTGQVLTGLGLQTPAPATPAPITPKAGQDWERDFTVTSGTLTMNLHLRRTRGGGLEGYYTVQNKGKTRSQRWPVAGQLLRDDSFTLHGTQNGATFTGSLCGGIPQVSEFHNRSFQLQNLRFRRLPSAAVVQAAAGTGATTTPTTTPTGAAAAGARSASSPLPNLPALREPGFLPRLRQVATAINTTPEIVLGFLTLESTLDPTSNKNNTRQYKGLGQIGDAARVDINRFIKSHGLALKTLQTTSELTGLTATQQLDYIEIHLKIHMKQVDVENKAAGKTSSLEQVYMAHLGGSARYAQKDVWVTSDSAAYHQNPMDADQDGQNTPTEAADTVRGKFTATFRANLDARSRHLRPTKRKFDGTVQLFYVYDPKYDNGYPLFSLGDAAPSVTPTPAVAGGASGATEHEPANAPDALDRLMKFTSETPEYTVAQVRIARQVIQIQPASARAELYLLLQEKTPHHSQRNNLSLGRAADGDKPGGRIGNVMCNLTSAAMVLEQLGIENPNPEHFPQFEDYLEDLRRKFVDAKYQELIKSGLSAKMARKGSYDRFHRTTQEGWGKVLDLMGTQHTNLQTSPDRAYWETKIKPHLAAGEAVMMSIYGHIVRLQGMDEEGLIVDDPYGRSKLLKTDNLKPEDRYGMYQHQANVSGNNTVWSWKSVAEHPMLWLAVVKKR